MKNWGHTLHFTPKSLSLPHKEDLLQKLVIQAAERSLPLRGMGAGHSWTPLIETEGILVRLDRLQGLISFSPSEQTATLWAGTRLYRALPLLWKEGYSLANQGDIDRQSLAGAFSTGTHGTGKAFGILATQARHYRFIDGEGPR